MFAITFENIFFTLYETQKHVYVELKESVNTDLLNFTFLNQNVNFKFKLSAFVVFKYFVGFNLGLNPGVR